MTRNTAQRRAILLAFEKTERPLSPQEVLQIAGRGVAQLGMATVYRNIKRLVEEAILEPVQLPGAPPRYELAGKHHHHHFHCRGCGRLYEVDGCLAAFRKLTPPGFQLEGHDLLLFGRCRRCVEKQTAANASKRAH